MDLSLEVKLGLSWQVVTSGYGDPPDGGFGGRRPPWDHFPGTSHLKLHFSPQGLSRLIQFWLLTQLHSHRAFRAREYGDERLL